MQLLSNPPILAPTFTVSGEAEERRNDLVLRSLANQSVTTPTEQNSAVDAGRDARAYIADVKKAGLEMRRPVSAALKTIIAIEEDHLAPLIAEVDRVARLVNNFQQQEARRVAYEQELRDIAIARLEADRIEQERLARVSATAMTSEADLAAALKQEAEARAVAELSQSVMREALPVVAKAWGVTTKKVMHYEVTDLRALYAARPELCSLEPKPSAIRAVVVVGMVVPGLRIWEETETSIRRS